MEAVSSRVAAGTLWWLTEAGLASPAQLTKLNSLDVGEPTVSAKGVELLKKTLPNRLTFGN
ncbi:MAG: hypothetical protein JWO38_1860 [Gemmataceae bacterium]|nr:hypothetical protein [Gemmataceae bacterium]